MQESSSEAVNAYYGVYLLGVARGDGALADWGRLLLAVELRGAKKYWHIKPTGPQIYPKPFAANGVVGVLWSTQVGAAAMAFRV
jgi:endo-1,3(4)-beta-glucanase